MLDDYPLDIDFSDDQDHSPPPTTLAEALGDLLARTPSLWERISNPECEPGRHDWLQCDPVEHFGGCVTFRRTCGACGRTDEAVLNVEDLVKEGFPA